MADKATLKEFLSLSVKVIITHTITYFVLGIIMSRVFNYDLLFQKEIIRDFMRSINSTYVLAGPFLQPLRGILFTIGIWPIRSLVFNKKYGWLILWNIIIIFGILSTPAAAPCSVEGLLYSRLPIWFHLIGLPEILIQTLFFSLTLTWWVNKKPGKKNLSEQSQIKRQLTLLLVAISIACFGYIGYAIGGILVAKIVGVKIQISGASFGLKSQLMFIIAFFVNVVSVFIFSRIWKKKNIKLVTLFFAFFFIDTTVPIIYQSIFSHAMPLKFALIIGFFPALIITLSLWLNRKTLSKLNS